MIDDNARVTEDMPVEEDTSTVASGPIARAIPTLLAGFTNGSILFVFCCVFSSMIFGQNVVLQQDVALGVGFFTASTAVAGAIFGRLSRYPGMIAGPDITPTVFMVELVTAVTVAICPDGVGGLEPGSTASASGSASGSASSSASGSVPLVLSGSGSGGYCERQHQVLPTCLVMMSFGTLLCGLGFALIGRFRLSTLVGFVPADVVAGFHACIGYKVVKAAVEVATGHPLKLQVWHYGWKYFDENFGSWRSWKLLLPALSIGVSLYLCKRRHWGRPMYIFPAFIIFPVLIFYVCLGAQALSIEDARSQNWFHPKLDT